MNFGIQICQMQTKQLLNTAQFIGSAVLSLALVAFAYMSDFPLLLLLPLAFLLSVIFILKPDLLFYLLAFTTPLSINPNDVELGSLSVSLPSEPIAIILVGLYFIMVFTTDKYSKTFLKHPISIVLYAFFIWLCICALLSSNLLVSVKFVLAKVWFIVPCYFLAAQYFKEDKNYIRYILLFILGMAIVSVYDIVHLSQYGFEDKPSQWTMQPFFKDHAILGAILAICVPLCIGLIAVFKGDLLRKFGLFFVLIILVVGLIFTYSRAAWVSIVPALVLYLLFVFRIKFKWLALVFVLGLSYVSINLNDIILNLEENKVSGSDDLLDNAESITNISTDPSNLERINRWSCALEMWNEKPWFGWGPGSFMVEYAPFQLRRNLTTISTNFGDVGNAHSEYLGLLSEAGTMGCIIFLVLMFAVFYYAFQYLFQARSRTERILLISSACALITYFTHGFLNNFLDTDKASNIFWPLIAYIAAWSSRANKKEVNKEQKVN